MALHALVCRGAADGGRISFFAAANDAIVGIHLEEDVLSTRHQLYQFLFARKLRERIGGNDHETASN